MRKKKHMAATYDNQKLVILWGNLYNIRIFRSWTFWFSPLGIVEPLCNFAKEYSNWWGH